MKKINKQISIIKLAVILIILMPIMYGISYLYEHTGSAGITMSMMTEEKILVDDKHYIILRSEIDPNYKLKIEVPATTWSLVEENEKYTIRYYKRLFDNHYKLKTIDHEKD
ncbi:hypothetical protein BKP35_07070 [Anaerobacillus arseniciselenatis]|uniref:Uncharacterized protein n=1 Tax=Anaerobacillus arseniciselenatis TaxID=85682 RepID=A0A1S2LS97_9BACI|nr:hypothetical protein [Anaerobacillus arseniciselenatis]OIJ14255.1 hypothetical protein BKP35_07070 [Anaerobacillus arseniciselenatis]